MTQGPKPRAAVLGSPIEHSLSPVIHLAAYAHLGLDWGYERVELQPAGFVGFVDALDDTWRGLSVTMPLKEQAAVCGVPDFRKLLFEAHVDLLAAIFEGLTSGNGRLSDVWMEAQVRSVDASASRAGRLSSSERPLDIKAKVNTRSSSSTTYPANALASDNVPVLARTQPAPARFAAAYRSASVPVAPATGR